MEHFDRLKSRIIVEEHSLTNVTTGHPEERNVLKLDFFKKNFKINVLSLDESRIVFELINIEFSFVNALRRVLLSEVPTMAFDRIVILNNTSVLQDEILSQRIGLCPVKVDPDLFTERTEGTEPSEKDTLEFKLHVKCEKGGKRESDRRDVTTADFAWVPLGDQANMFVEGEEPCLVDVESPIVLTKLLPGQEVDLIAQCFKSNGGDHAKFQPVATAWYKPLPQIVLKRRITGEAARRLQSCFSPGVIDIHVENGEEVARVANPRLDTVSRNVFKYDDLSDAVELSLAKDHFIFTVESTGILSPVDLVKRAIRILITKAQRMRHELNKFEDAS